MRYDVFGNSNESGQTSCSKEQKINYLINERNEKQNHRHYHLNLKRKCDVFGAVWKLLPLATTFLYNAPQFLYPSHSAIEFILLSCFVVLLMSSSFFPSSIVSRLSLTLAFVCHAVRFRCVFVCLCRFPFVATISSQFFFIPLTVCACSFWAPSLVRHLRSLHWASIIGVKMRTKHDQNRKVNKIMHSKG